MICSPPTKAPQVTAPITPEIWGQIWQAHIEAGRRNGEQIAAILTSQPMMSPAQLGKLVGCSRKTARKWKKRILDKKVCMEIGMPQQQNPNNYQERRITKVYLWQNGIVMVFDQFGEQMAEYQGPVEEVEDKIKAVYSGPWHGGNWQSRSTWLIDK